MRYSSTAAEFPKLSNISNFLFYLQHIFIHLFALIGMIFLICFVDSLRRDARGVFRDIPPPAPLGAPDARAPRRALRRPQRGLPLLPPIALRREQLRVNNCA